MDQNTLYPSAQQLTYENIDEYIAEFPPEKQETLRKVRQSIREAAPDATEKISYGMPTFWQGENLIHFAAMKAHLGIYPTSSGVEAFADRLIGYKTTKGTVQIPWSKPVPYDLISDMTRFRVEEVELKRITKGKNKESAEGSQ